jgi:glutamyl-tRNA synthetase
MSQSPVITRFAPSPTGYLHAGAYRTAIFSYLYARKHGGTFVLRIEDTDKERSQTIFEENILESLAWMGLQHDVFYRQSEHVERHKEVLLRMISDGHAYISKEEAKDGSGVIKEIVRFKNPNIDVTFRDEIKGDVTMNTTDLGDFVIAKNISEPLFHLAVVVDDFDEGVTHVIRGEDHVSNTPRQILIQRAIGAPTPTYAHLPLVLGLDKRKLSKRRGALALTEYRAKGFLPEAILNMVAMVGWNPGTEQELFSRDELTQAFDLSRVQHASAIFNEDKLRWFNKEHLKLAPEVAQYTWCEAWLPPRITSHPSYSDLRSHILPLLLERASSGEEVSQLVVDGEIDFFFDQPSYDALRLYGKDTPDSALLLKRFQKLLELLTQLSAHPSTEEVKSVIFPYAEEEGRGSVLWPLRYALSGREKSPDPFQIISIIGTERARDRIAHAQSLLLS